MANTNNARFQGGHAGTTYQCRDCSKRTRETGSGESSVELCRSCFLAAELENAHSDGHHIDEPDTDCPDCVQPAAEPVLPPSSDRRYAEIREALAMTKVLYDAHYRVACAESGQIAQSNSPVYRASRQALRAVLRTYLTWTEAKNAEDHLAETGDDIYTTVEKVLSRHNAEAAHIARILRGATTPTVA